MWLLGIEPGYFEELLVLLTTELSRYLSILLFWPRTHFVDQVALKSTEIHLSVPSVLGLEVCAAMPGPVFIKDQL